MSSETYLYWYPLGTGALKTTTIPDFVTDVDDVEIVAVSATSETTAGAMMRQHYGAWRRVSIVRQHLRPAKAAEKLAIEDLWSIDDHLEKGYSVGIAIGENKTWASIGGVNYPAGTTTVIAPANAYAAWSATSNPVAGDVLVMQSPEPDGARELLVVDSVVAVGTSLSITFTYGTRYPHAGPWLLRHRRFYPALKRPEDQLGVPALTSVNLHLTENLALTLREDMPQIWSIGQGGQLAGADDTGWANTPDEIAASNQANRNRRPR